MRTSLISGIISFLLAFTIFLSERLSMAEQNPILDQERLEGLVHAPEFPPNLEWLNAEKPISLEALRGKLVLLDFWTYCCINCMHVIPDLKRLETKYAEELVVIGVHSAKFPGEKDDASIRKAILRYGVEHPVVNDSDMQIWNAYAIRAWPSFVLINPHGRIIGTQSGENVFELFDQVIAEAIKHFDSKQIIDRTPFEFILEKAKRKQTLLMFPGKIKADLRRERLYISDSGNHRLLVADEDGNILDVIGSGRVGASDGDFETAEFSNPQGTYANGDFLYIADTENHLIREANLKTRRVRTLVGTGKQARKFNEAGKGTEVALNSPWDLVGHGNFLYIAMAGAHQIWVTNLLNLETKPHAGSGKEGLLDGPLLDASLAQPSGITTDGTRLYFVDSETSAVRVADIDEGGAVTTFAGEDLFVFGDEDGEFIEAKLQHPLGISHHDGLLYIADTYNSKIKRLDLEEKRISTLAGQGSDGDQNGPAIESSFFEPGGLVFFQNKIFVADTNNHQIRQLDLDSKDVDAFRFQDVEKIAGRTLREFQGRTVDLPKQVAKPGKGTLTFDIDLPEGFILTGSAPFHLMWSSSDQKAFRILKPSDSVQVKQIAVPIALPFEAAAGESEILFESVIYYCREDSTVCLFDHVKVKLPLEVKEGGSRNLRAAITVEPKG